MNPVRGERAGAAVERDRYERLSRFFFRIILLLSILLPLRLLSQTTSGPSGAVNSSGHAAIAPAQPRKAEAGSVFTGHCEHHRALWDNTLRRDPAFSGRGSVLSVTDASS